jgi:hypothetical protein
LSVVAGFDAELAGRFLRAARRDPQTLAVFERLNVLIAGLTMLTEPRLSAVAGGE